WRVKEEEFKNARKTSRRVGSSASSLYPLAKNSLKEGIAVTLKDVKFHMTNLLSNEFKLSYPNALNTFKASDPWLNLFMNRFNLSLRRRTKTSQKLPKDLHEKVTEFHSFINELRINNNFELNCIANMDETSVYFDIVGAYTINDRVLADGSKLSLMVIFKGKRLEAVWKQRPGRQNKRSLLVFDLFKGHLTMIVKDKCYDMNTILGVIPGGLTSVVQSLDKGNMKKPEHNIMCHWVMEVWNEISTEIIIKSFKKCGLFNTLDNSKNYLIELDQIEEKENCIIDLVDENKENEENIATSSVPYINAERSYLIRENETEMMSVLLC
ncbi:79_t:CDS:2, partial [Dentiscutata erythropus]